MRTVRQRRVQRLHVEPEGVETVTAYVVPLATGLGSGGCRYLLIRQGMGRGVLTAEAAPHTVVSDTEARAWAARRCGVAQQAVCWLVPAEGEK